MASKEERRREIEEVIAEVVEEDQAARNKVERAARAVDRFRRDSE